MEQNEVKVEAVIEQKESADELDKKAKTNQKNELLRELSKEYGISLFDAEGIQKFKEYQDSQKSEAQKLQEKAALYETEVNTYKSKTESLEVQIAAMRLGITEDKIQDAVVLAKAKKMENETIEQALARVQEAYGEVFGKSQAKKQPTSIKVGTQINDLVQDAKTDKPDSDFIDAFKKLNKNKK